MLDLGFAYSLNPEMVGRPAQFQPLAPEIILDVEPNSTIRKKFIVPHLVETEICNVAPMTEHSTSTEHKTVLHSGMYHSEGGWPKDVDPNEPEQLARFQRKAEKEEAYLPMVRHLYQTLKASLRQNNAIDIYEAQKVTEGDPLPIVSSGAESFAFPTSSTAAAEGGGGRKSHSPDRDRGSTSSGGFSEREGGGTNDLFLSVEATMADPWERATQLGNPPPLRVASCTNWHLADSARHKLAVAYCYPQEHFDGGVNGSQLQAVGNPVASFIYDVNKPHIPETSLLGPTSLSCLRWSPREIHWLGAGCTDGTVCLFDVRRAPKPAFRTSIQHRGTDAMATPVGAVTSLQWLQVGSKSTELLTVQGGSPFCFVWDIRNLVEPVDLLRLSGARYSSGGATCADYCSTSNIGPGKLLVGTTNGHVLAVARRGRSTQEGSDRVQTVYGQHHGPIAAVHRHPIISKCFASAGDWTVRLWTDDLKTPIVCLPWSQAPVVDLAWHPAKPPLLAVALENGYVQLWNLLFRTDKPQATIRATQGGIHSIGFNHDGSLLSVGTTESAVVLIRLCGEYMATANAAPEKVALQTLLDQEAGRERTVAHDCKDVLTTSATFRSQPLKTNAPLVSVATAMTSLDEMLSVPPRPVTLWTGQQLDQQLAEVAEEFTDALDLAVPSASAGGDMGGIRRVSTTSQSLFGDDGEEDRRKGLEPFEEEHSSEDDDIDRIVHGVVSATVATPPPTPSHRINATAAQKQALAAASLSSSSITSNSVGGRAAPRNPTRPTTAPSTVNSATPRRASVQH